MTREEREKALREKLLMMRQYEEELYRKGVSFIAGVDEAGRGPLAGPVVAAAVVLPSDFDIIGIDDSKKLSEKKRDYFFPIIQEKALVYGIGIIDNLRIDQVNILEATKEAMLLALAQAETKLEAQKRTKIEHVLFDAITIEKLPISQTSIIKGDSKSISIAAASILAKVTRDRIMKDLENTYPGYHFERNKGYGTKAHYEGLSKLGMCPVHRRSFLKNIKEWGT